MNFTNKGVVRGPVVINPLDADLSFDCDINFARRARYEESYKYLHVHKDCLNAAAEISKVKHSVISWITD